MGTVNFDGKNRQTITKIYYGHSAVICANTAEPIEVPFGLWARMGPRHHVLHGGSDPPFEGAILVDRGAHCKL